ncbi:TIGR01212 family radical SAM protein [Balneolaceae bacterium ANBcel3]|nr:TIGR01212 family radical SAM protein [Balneolaceae bacterium ANBcel3]
MKKRNKPYFDYYNYLKNAFGDVTYKVSVDGGFTCPNIDGHVTTGGCTYCNNRSFVPKYLDRKTSIRNQVSHGVQSQKERYGAKKFLAYFQAYSNTYAPVEILEERYKEALEHPDVHGLVLGTRADCLDEPVLSLLESISKEYYVAVEVGIESVFDQTLKRINRGHDYQAVKKAFSDLEGRGVHLGAHLILGLPGENHTMWLDTAAEMSALPLDYLKIHHLQVVRGTQLEKEYHNDPFPLFSFEEWIDLACNFIARLRPDIAIARVCGSAPAHLLTAPKWGRKKHPEVISGIMDEMDKRGWKQGDLYQESPVRL